MDTIHVYVGADPNGCDAEWMLVLEHSARKVTTGPIEFHWMQLSPDKRSPWSAEAWATENWPTPFSGFRWAVPWAHKHAGRALYMDSDMVILRDLRDLWNMSIPNDKIVAAKSNDRFCVALWDCEKVGKLVKAGQLPNPETARSDPMYHERMKRGFAMNPHLIEKFDTNWNNIDGEDRPLSEAFILHCSAMDYQPSHKYSVPRLKAEGKPHWFDGEIKPHWRADIQQLFDDTLAEALASGRKVEDTAKTNLGGFTKLSQKGYSANHGYDPNSKK